MTEMTWRPENRRKVTIRESTEAERTSMGQHFLAGHVDGPRGDGTTLRAKKWIVVDADQPKVWLGAFGFPDTADTREEAMFWAERWCSKNDGMLIRPEGWEDVVGALPPDEEDDA